MSRASKDAHDCERALRSTIKSTGASLTLVGMRLGAASGADPRLRRRLAHLDEIVLHLVDSLLEHLLRILLREHAICLADSNLYKNVTSLRAAGTRLSGVDHGVGIRLHNPAKPLEEVRLDHLREKRSGKD